MSLKSLAEMKDSDLIVLPTADRPILKRRVEWLDASRALAMFFIVWIHTDNPPAWIRPIGEACLILFFILAGYFLPRCPAKCLRRTYKLFIAYCLWSLISYLLFMNPLEPFAHSWQHAIGWGNLPLNYPLWFLKELIIYQFIMCGLMYLRILPRYAWLLLILLASFSYTLEYGDAGPMRFSWMISLALGYALANYHLARITQYMQDHLLVISIAVFLIFLQPRAIAVLAPYFDLSSYRPMLLISPFACAMLLAIFSLSLAKLCPRLLSPLAFAGRCMMFIYATHVLLFKALSVVQCHCFGGVFIDGLWTCLIAFIVLIPLCLFLQRFFPRMMTLLVCPPSK